VLYAAAAEAVVWKDLPKVVYPYRRPHLRHLLEAWRLYRSEFALYRLQQSRLMMDVTDLDLVAVAGTVKKSEP
jgi:hypothetical protein